MSLLKYRRVLIGFLIPCSQLIAQSQNPTFVGVVRSDGLLQLTAKFDGKTWSGLPALPTWEGMPRIPDRWLFCSTPETTTKELTVGEPVHFERWDRVTTWAFLTDYCPREVGLHFVPYPKVGFALDQQVNAIPMITLDSLSEDWQRLRRQTLSMFENTETQALSKDPVKHDHLLIPRTAEDRQRFPNRLGYLSRTNLPIGNQHIYRFEVSRYYPAGAGCSSIAHLQGWAIAKSNLIFIIDQDFSFGDCDGKGLNANLRPLGVFESNDRTFLVIEGSGYEGEYNVISEVVDNRIVTLVETE